MWLAGVIVDSSGDGRMGLRWHLYCSSISNSISIGTAVMCIIAPVVIVTAAKFIVVVIVVVVVVVMVRFVMACGRHGSDCRGLICPWGLINRFHLLNYLLQERFGFPPNTYCTCCPSSPSLPDSLLGHTVFQHK